MHFWKLGVKMSDLPIAWQFDRLKDGSVQINITQIKQPDVRAVIKPVEWASIVASVSDGGDTLGRRMLILDFHGEGE